SVPWDGSLSCPCGFCPGHPIAPMLNATVEVGAQDERPPRRGQERSVDHCNGHGGPASPTEWHGETGHRWWRWRARRDGRGAIPNGPFASILIRADRLAAGPGREGLVGAELDARGEDVEAGRLGQAAREAGARVIRPAIDRLLEELDRAVHHREVRAAG